MLNTNTSKAGISLCHSEKNDTTLQNMMVAVSHHRVPLVINELFCLHCFYLSTQSSNPFLPLTEVKLHIFARVAILQQELTKLHKRTACGEAQCFQHFLLPGTTSTTANFWVVSATILSLGFLLCSPLCHPRAMTVSCDKTSHGFGRAKPQRNDYIAGGCSGGKKIIWFLSWFSKSDVSFME